MRTALIFTSGIGILVLFVVAILLSLNKNISGFLRYFMAYLCFIVAIGLLFYLFGDAYIWIGFIAAGGWIFFIVKGSRYQNRESEQSKDNHHSPKNLSLEK